MLCTAVARLKHRLGQTLPGFTHSSQSRNHLCILFWALEVWFCFGFSSFLLFSFCYLFLFDYVDRWLQIFIVISLTGNYKLLQHNYPLQNNGPQVQPVRMRLAKGALLHKPLVWFWARADWIIYGHDEHLLRGLNCIWHSLCKGCMLTSHCHTLGESLC